MKKLLITVLVVAALVVAAGGGLVALSRHEATVPIEQTYGPDPFSLNRKRSGCPP
ncbi:hypothetical protein SAMN05216459_12645 [Ensifer sp. OV372]|nr:hypothetical protein SAMN05216459_12645 [Ensifer sp. OV372]